MQAVAQEPSVKKPLHYAHYTYLQAWIGKLNIERLITQLPSPYILMGDFKAHSNLWVCGLTDKMGSIWITFLLITTCHSLILNM